MSVVTTSDLVISDVVIVAKAPAPVSIAVTAAAVLAHHTQLKLKWTNLVLDW